MLDRKFNIPENCHHLEKALQSFRHRLAFTFAFLRRFVFDLPRIGDSKIYTTPAEQAEIVRMGELLEHDIADLMLVVKSGTYRR